MPTDRRTKGASPELRALGRLIVYLRMDAGVSQKKLAATLRTSSSQVSKWEWGQVDLQVRSREKIAAAFDLDFLALEDLAQRLDRSVTRYFAHRGRGVAEPTDETDAASVESLIEALRLRRRDLEAERIEIDEAIRATGHEEQSLRNQLDKLRRS
jgi:transcriptional regulator with XRE-family HTH domain